MFRPVAVVIWLSLSAVAAVAGPFGTYEMFPFETRLPYWFIVVGISVFMGRAIRLFAERVLSQNPVWLEVFAVSAMTLAITAVLWVLTPVLLGVPSRLTPTFERMGLYVFTVSVSVAVLRRWALARADVAAQVVGQGPHPRLVARLPEPMRGRVLRLSGNGHHVEIVTEHGPTSVRMRLADAIAEMEAVSGVCTHRSHWVTRDAIAGVERAQGRVVLQLVNGDQVPVSRKYAPALEAEGLI